MRGWIRPARIGAAVLVLAALVVPVPAGPTRAHSQLVSSAPADGEVLTARPEVLSFTFNEALLDQGHAITARDARGEFLALPEPTVAGDTIAVAWPDDAPDGSYTAAYRVVSADGHPITGEITFTVATQVGSVGSSAPSSAPSGHPSAYPTTRVDPAAGPRSAGALVGLVALGGLLLVVAVGGIWVTRRSRGR